MGAPIRVSADQGLDHRRGELIGQGNEADLREAEVEIALEQRIHRQHQGLDHIVQKMGNADRPQHLKTGCGKAGKGGGSRGGKASRIDVVTRHGDGLLSL